MKQKVLPLLLVLITGIVLGYFAPRSLSNLQVLSGVGRVAYQSIVSVDGSIEFLEEARHSHQFYIDYPEYANEYTGSVEFNQSLVKRYSEVILILESCKH